jgi:hypothetical protein
MSGTAAAEIQVAAASLNSRIACSAVRQGGEYQHETVHFDDDDG